MDSNNLINQLNEATKFELPTVDSHENNVFSELTEKAGFNLQFWNEIINLQLELNEKVITNWVNQNLNWKMAILIENAEAMDSLNWSWWKVRDNDWNNFETEMVDIFCFNIAKLLETKSTNILIPYIASKELQFQNETSKRTRDNNLAQDILRKLSEEFMMSIVTGNFLASIMIWFDIWYMLGNNITDFFKHYKIKYTLNIFRQDHGYKEGTYQKIWNGEEDNVRVKELSVNLEYSETFFEDLYSLLEGYYGTIEDVSIRTINTFLSSNEKWNLFMVNVPEATRKIMLDLAEDYNKYSKS